MAAPWICTLFGWFLASCATTVEMPPPAAPVPGQVAGRVYVGSPTGQKSETGCEGCGQPGEFSFSTDGRVHFVLPGSDILDAGDFKQVGDRITITGTRRKDGIEFDVVEGGQAIVDRRYRTRYARKQ